MKQVKLKINDNTTKPISVDELGRVQFMLANWTLDELERVGIEIIEVKRPLKWDGTLVICNILDAKICIRVPQIFSEDMKGKRFHAVLTEIVEGE